MEPDEQALLKGFIINKFRGDKTILDPGVRMLEERGGVPVVGVVPYMQLDLDDEDSLSPQLEQTNRPSAGKPVEIAVIRLPHLSNFTDLNVFLRIPEVDLRYVSRPGPRGSGHGHPSGHENTIEDLLWLKEVEWPRYRCSAADGPPDFWNLRRLPDAWTKVSDPEVWRQEKQVRPWTDSVFWMRRLFYRKDAPVSAESSAICPAS